MSTSKIEWTKKTWNPISGCTKISPGCQHCYAEKMATTRLRGRCGYDQDHPFQVTFHPDRLERYLHRKKPTVIFVCSMGDLFHSDVEDSWIDQVFEIIRQCPQHTFQILTKRAGRMFAAVEYYVQRNILPPNIWFGVTVESPEYLDRLVTLSTLPLTRFVSIEPMLTPFPDLRLFAKDSIDWVIVGAESGSRARPMREEWVTPILHRCQEQGIPFFYKQRILNGKKVSLPTLEGRQWAQMPG